MPETQARLRYVRISPTKARPVLALIRGQDIMTARDTLRLSDRAVSREIAKLLESAVANAEHNNHVLEDELFVARAFADEGPTMKRWRPRARGRGVRIRNRASHITIVLDRYSDFDDALARVNASRYGLQSCVFTHDARRIRRAFEELEVGECLPSPL